MEPRMVLSIHELPPLETGGVNARRGFSIQDHVAAGFCLHLLGNNALKEVWCENQDDVALIWDHDGKEEVEFVQVKGDEFDQLWSIAKLCDRKRTDGQPVVGTSILERSLAYDRCSEPCYFRIVTIRPVMEELRPLTYALDSQSRILAQNKINELTRLVAVKVGNFRSPNNNGHDFWISHAVWDEAHSESSIKTANLLRLLAIVEAEGEHLFGDQIEELYERLLTKVYNAGRIRWVDQPDGKKLKKPQLVGWFVENLRTMAYPAPTGGGQTVKQKMEAARLPQDAIDTANDQRRRYREELLGPQYLQTREIRMIEDEVTALLQDLRSQLDAGLIADSGVQFHARCLQQLAELRDRLPITPPPLGLLHGCMYSIADRCLHRFARAET
jgi:predicted esterase YcpF (UPF0227 family)